MSGLTLHHVALIVTDLERSAAFYREVLDLPSMPRPPFETEGMWLACGPLQLHLIVYPAGSFRTENLDSDDLHFALRTDDFEGVVARLVQHGFREDASDDDPKRIVVRRDSVAGFAQLYVLDPDRNVIEINAAP
jgi:glyoxylase I family protein